jgi:hypothetical protein
MYVMMGSWNIMPGMGRRAQKNWGGIVVKEHVIKRFSGVLESECCPAEEFHQDAGEKFLLAFAFHQGK